MRKLTLSLLGLLLSSHAWAAIAFVQGNNVQNPYSGGVPYSGTLAYTANNTAGDLLVFIGVTQPDCTSTIITDTQANTWTKSGQTTGSSSVGLELWYVLSAKAGANTVTFSYLSCSSTVESAQGIVEYSGGIWTAGTYGGNSGGTSSSISATAGQLLIGVGAGAFVTLGVGTGYTLRSSASFLTGGATQVLTEDRIAPSTTTFTASVTGGANATTIASFTATPAATTKAWATVI